MDHGVLGNRTQTTLQMDELLQSKLLQGKLAEYQSSRKAWGVQQKQEVVHAHNARATTGVPLEPKTRAQIALQRKA